MNDVKKSHMLNQLKFMLDPSHEDWEHKTWKGIARHILQKEEGAAVAEWLSSWLAEQEDRGSIPRLAT